jgi:hypothetical protein
VGGWVWVGGWVGVCGWVWCGVVLAHAWPLPSSTFLQVVSVCVVRMGAGEIGSLRVARHTCSATHHGGRHTWRGIETCQSSAMRHPCVTLHRHNVTSLAVC